MDDEYAHAGEVDPRVLITTSRDPSSRLSQFAKELKVLVPNAQRLNRGNQVGDQAYHAPTPSLFTSISLTQRTTSQTQVLPELVESCRNHGFTDLVVVHEHRGEPDGLVVCHMPYGPTAYFGLYNAVLRHDIGDKKEVCVLGVGGLMCGEVIYCS